MNKSYSYLFLFIILLVALTKNYKCIPYIYIIFNFIFIPEVFK